MTTQPEPRDRRVQFFAVAAMACLALYYPAPEDMRWVPLVLAAAYLVLAGLTWLDQRTNRR